MKKTFGRKVTIFLMDDDIDGKIKATISEWRGLVYRIPRSKLDDCKTIEAFKNSGVYFLFKDRKVYVGQAGERATGDAVLRRILEHASDWLANDWDEAVVLTTQSGSPLDKADISFLENYFYLAAKEAGRYELLNRSTPSQGTVPEEDIASLSQYGEYAKLVLGLLGYKAFDNTHNVPPSNPPRKEEEASSKDEVLKKLFPTAGYKEIKKGAVFQSTDHLSGSVFLESKVYKDSDKEKYWFGYRPKRFDPIKDCVDQYLVLTCKNSQDLYVSLPRSFIENIVENLNCTRDPEGNIRHYHIILLKDNTGKVVLQLAQPEKKTIDVTKYIL